MGKTFRQVHLTSAQNSHSRWAWLNGFGVYQHSLHADSCICCRRIQYFNGWSGCWSLNCAFGHCVVHSACCNGRQTWASPHHAVHRVDRTGHLRAWCAVAQLFFFGGHTINWASTWTDARHSDCGCCSRRNAPQLTRVCHGSSCCVEWRWRRRCCCCIARCRRQCYIMAIHLCDLTGVADSCICTHEVAARISAL